MKNKPVNGVTARLVGTALGESGATVSRLVARDNVPLTGPVGRRTARSIPRPAHRLGASRRRAR